MIIYTQQIFKLTSQHVFQSPGDHIYKKDIPTEDVTSWLKNIGADGGKHLSKLINKYGSLKHW